MWSYVQYRNIGASASSRARNRGGNRNVYNSDRSLNPSRLEESRNTPDKGQISNDDEAEAGRALESPEQTPNGTPDPDTGHIVVETTGDDDDFDPRNWPLTSRAKNIIILGLLIFTQAWAGAADSIANTKASQEFHVGKVTQNLSTALYLFGIGSGCLFVGPLSETLGRNPTYLISTFFYLFFVLGTALTKNAVGMYICRYFVGLFASATLGINGASVKDQFRPVKTSFVFPFIAWVNVAPPVIAPIIGGWILSNPNLNWRWMEWVLLIISAAAFLLALVFLPETYLPLLLDWKAKHLRKSTGDDRYVSKHAEKPSLLKGFKSNITLSRHFLIEPVIAVLGAYLVLLYILLFTFLSGFEYIFKNTYNLSDGMYGSCFASLAVGATTFMLTVPWLYNWTRNRTQHVHGAPVTPEFCLWPAIYAAPFLPISLFWLGWTNDPNISIWSGLAACFVFGNVLIAMYVSSYEYIIDSYGDHAAVALASITMMRYLIAGGMVMAARPMFEGIGVHWTLTFLGCISALLTPGPFLLHKYGYDLRKRSQFVMNKD
ncbi:MFS general substrate transporter [Microthyrium microscopicum]|uniref:MFS general substrate transporter n=1 Tax=Microthyrium microscopicum TaxID=703497 RepID=A0A6A6UMB7_9PEZI|nr:MFS general substrate transporter [Microthyrium microscopicum]